MARKSVALNLEDVIAEIEDTLGDLTIVNPVFGRVTNKQGLLPGYYVQYQISPQDVYRAVYLGDGVKVGEMKRNFDKWASNWRV
jgi:hypothetical protein